MATFRAFHHRTFSLLIAGQTLSRIGDFLYQVALAWWVLEKTNSGIAMGMVFLFTLTPTILFVLLGGALVDRLPRTRLLFLSDLGRGVIMLLIALLALSNRLELWMVYIGSLLFGFADAFFTPALQALIPQIIPQVDLTSANSINSLSVQLGRVAGPALGGILVGLGGTTLAFGINATSFLLSAITLIPLLSIPAPARAEQIESTPQHLLADIREGFQTTVASPILWISIITFAVVNITLAGPFSVGMPFLVKNHLNGDEKMLGLLYAIFPIGYAISGLVLGSAKRLRYRGILSYLCGAIAGIGLGVFGLDLPLWALIVAALINGAALEVGGLIWINILQELVPEEKLGRVSSIDTLGSFVLLPLGFAFTGWLVDHVDVAIVFIAAGIVAGLASLFPLLHPSIRELD
jgi:DHA3 family tetracycline resistance protein-like MFS transporter